VGALALLLIGAGAALLAVVRYTLVSETDAFLAVEARRLAGELTNPEHDVPDHADLAEAVRTPDDPARSAGGVSGPAVGLLFFDKNYLRYVDSHRHTLAMSPDLAAAPDLVASLDTLLPASTSAGASPERFAYAGPDEESTMRVVTIPARFRQEPIYVQTAVPWDHNADVIEALGALLAISLPVVLVPVALGAWALVGRTLRPIRRIVTEAEALDAADLPEALLPEATETDSEIGELVATLNRMTTRLYDAFGTQRRFSEMQQQFAANASHELRTPLTVLRGEIELAMARPRTADSYQAALARLLEQAVRMERIVDGLGVLARRDAGRPERREGWEIVDLSAIAAAVADEIRSQAREKRIDLRPEPGQCLATVPVRGNAEQLLQLLRNLIENAVKYTPAGGSVDIRVTAAPDGSGSRIATVTVRDTGIGISEEDLPHVFDRFWRADRSRSSPGTGLGLAISAQIAEIHGGELTVASALETGSVFSLRLPVAADSPTP